MTGINFFHLFIYLFIFCHPSVRLKRAMAQLVERCTSIAQVGVRIQTNFHFRLSFRSRKSCVYNSSPDVEWF